MQHFYDGQIRRYITQLVRLFSNFSYEDGKGNLTQIPVMYGDLTRQVANIIRDNSENKIPSAPRMAVYITGLEQDRSRTSDASYVSKVHIRERAYDEANQEYLNEQGKNYTVERLMPTPYILRVNVDVWSTNTDQKLQILEQLLTLFNPSMEIQTTDNYIDWTSLTSVMLEGITFSTRTVPVGVDSEIDVAQLQFSTPIYISPPAKVKRLGVITNIIASIFNEQTGNINLGLSLVGGLEPEFTSTRSTLNSDGTQETIVDDGEFPNTGDGTMDIGADFSYVSTAVGNTYRNYGVSILGNEAQIIYRNQVGNVEWHEVFQAFPGTYRSGISQIRLQTERNNFIIGTFSLNPLDPTKITINFDSDTLPDDDIIAGRTSIDYIIDPLRFNPTQEKSPGLRLLLLGKLNDSSSVGDSSYDGPDAWKNADGTDFVADENDIVEWDGTKWSIVFDASESNDVVYTSNLNTGIQYKWDGEYWVRSYEGEYSQGAYIILLDG